MDRWTIRPDQWVRWAERFLPAAEPFFLADPVVIDTLAGSGEIVQTRAEFSDEFPRFALDHGIPYRIWTLRGATHVWLADHAARERIDLDRWAAVRDAQATIGRGQVYGEDWPVAIDVPAADRLAGGRYLLAPHTWRSLGPDVRRRWLREWVTRRLAEDDLHPVEGWVAPAYRAAVARWAGTFADTSGPNCFAATLGFALDRPDILARWLHAEPFRRTLRATGWRPADGTPRPGDVLEWVDGETPVHAAFVVGDGLVFNKYGQAWDQPYAVLALDDLLNPSGVRTVYRRG